MATRSRRRFLRGCVAASAAALAGCSDGSGPAAEEWLWLRPATDERLVALTTNAIDGTDTTSTVREFADRIVTRGHVNGTATDLPDPGASFYDEPTRYDGAVYDFTADTELVERRRYYVTVEPAGESTPDPAGTVPYSALSPLDRRLLWSEGRPSEADRTEFRVTLGGANLSRTRVLTDEDVTAVRRNGTVYDLAVDREAAYETRRYHVTYADRWSAAEFAARMRARYRFRLRGLGEAERTVFETLRDQGEYAVTDDDEAARSLLERVERHDGLPDVRHLPGATPSERPPFRSAVWLLRYAGDDYLFQWTRKTYDHARRSP